MDIYTVELFCRGLLCTVKVTAKDRREAIKLAEERHSGLAVSAKANNPMSGGGSKKG